MKRSQAFPSRYLGKDDLDEPRVFIVDDVVQEDLEQDGQMSTKAVMHFRERDAKPWIINVGNWMTIEDAYGDDSNDWIGKPVELFVDPSVMFGQKRVGGVRVRVPKQDQTQTSQPQTQMATETIQTVDVKGDWFGIRTDKGLFVTDNKQLGETVQSFGKTDVTFTYTINGQGKRVASDAAPASAPVNSVAGDEEDIPF